MNTLDKQNGPNKFVWLVASLLTLSISACSVNKSTQNENNKNSNINNVTEQTFAKNDDAKKVGSIEQNNETNNCDDQYCYIENNSVISDTSSFSFKNDIKPAPAEIKSSEPDDFLISTHVKRNYSEIPKGSYKYDTYTVKRGDTLYYIGWITGRDFKELAAQNGISDSYELEVGQILNVKKDGKFTSNLKPAQIKKDAITVNKVSTVKKQTEPTTRTVQSKTTTATTTAKQNVKSSDNKAVAKNTNSINFIWPVPGEVTETFTKENKGINIAGKLGDKVVAAASGVVVYAGNALPGYGNIIIIKHNDDFITAYAHNQTIMVKELDAVKAGQQIATMGSTGTNSVKLHFEVRYKVKSVDPLQYLPKR